MARPRVRDIEPGSLPPSWYAGGPECDERPDFTVHAYNDDLHILRQAACTNYEKPFLYLIFGRDQALLLDTGAGDADVVAAVDGVIRSWLARNQRTSTELVIPHSHGHGDHVAGDAEFRARPGTTVVGADPASVQAFFRAVSWPTDIAQYDLGERVLDIIPIPGHEPASIAVYDRRTGLLLTGDTLYPGRLYLRDGPAFVASIRRLVDFTRDRPVSLILGTHIENTATPSVDYPAGTVDQPNEHVLQLSRDHLVELDDALKAMHGKVVRYVMRDFTIWPVS